ncbi:hypothetical protein HZA56_11830 [Candidatus Poribacteria bacterium]|nr:hypothetical protein [Candidatus Poribacteria bacterium]
MTYTRKQNAIVSQTQKAINVTAQAGRPKASYLYVFTMPPLEFSISVTLP